MNKKLTRLLLSLINDLDHDLENDKVKEILKLQRVSQDKILSKVASITLEHNVDDNLMDIPINLRNDLKREVSKLINDTTRSEYQSEQQVVKDILRTTTARRYTMNSYFYDTVFEIDYNLKQLSNREITKIINRKIKGQSWDDRTWRNKKTLNKQLRKEIYNLLDGKTNVNRISEDISKRYKQTFNRSRTLVRTETTRVQAEINEQWAKDNGIDKQMFVATLDDRTSETCEEYDGEVYDIDDSSKPIPPLHPNCRSVLVNIPYEDWEPKTRIDNITKENINYVDYKAWNRMN